MQKLESARDADGRGGGQYVGMPSDGDLCLDEKQVALGRAVNLLLFGARVPRVCIGDLLGDGKCRKHQAVGQRLGFSPTGLTKKTRDIAGETNALLPDLEVLQRCCHGANVYPTRRMGRIEPLRFQPEYSGTGCTDRVAKAGLMGSNQPVIQWVAMEY